MNPAYTDADFDYGTPNPDVSHANVPYDEDEITPVVPVTTAPKLRYAAKDVITKVADYTVTKAMNRSEGRSLQPADAQ